ncbi:Rrf2 family transcriptional regulator [Lactobacillus sp. PV037]|uniref:Rrf2 family transcriptional regulator n=1 Tax=unclassified Lactobacillus TaxID=2620435 RepID=UPI00223FBDE6|nr:MULTISPECIES: Rrf2 family transcriptional regulator [unclassified Lactobacillus]QNQ81643.1 Rrf2 family transcriptional regulator [Lactobacillus sp. PV012]QNQ84310.1 Rrf2 family transcriptional regulator [Lactobacillus sp. PV037]
MNDIKFSVAIHILVMVATSSKPLNSEDLAKSIGTNASYVRKVLALLKKGELVESHRGKSGINLIKNPAEISLLEIYETVEQKKPTFFEIHQNSNPECIVGKNIKEVVFPIESNLEKQIAQSLAAENLVDVINRLKVIVKDEKNGN